MTAGAVIPSYELPRGDELSLPFRFLLLDRSDGSYNPSEPHRHNYYEVFYFVKGGGEHDIDFQSYAIRDHSMHFVTPGQVHQIRRAPDSHGFIILFTSEFYALSLHGRELHSGVPFLNPGPPYPILHPDGADRELMLQTIGMMQNEVKADSEYREEMLRSYLNILLLQARRLLARSGRIASDEEHPEHELVSRLRALIERDFINQHAPSAYAAVLNVSRNHLNSTVKKMTGTTIGGLINERLVLEAKRLLFHTEMSVKEIAYALNFDDPSYFTRFFRRHSGLSPHEFREQQRSESY
jgi:AraC family transcriptional regulator, transcriptional activator of pobA